MDFKNKCPICLKIINLPNSVKTSCNHYFCSNCFFQWIYEEKTCPCCRKQLIKNLTEDEEADLEWIRRRYVELDTECYSLAEIISKQNEEISSLKLEISKYKKNIINKQNLLSNLNNIYNARKIHINKLLQINIKRRKRLYF